MTLSSPPPTEPYRREITWNVFDEKANRFANMLLSPGHHARATRWPSCCMNCLEWLPIYFGILKTGALAVPFNFRYSAEEIEYCADLAEVQVLVFGPEFIGRIESVAEKLSKGRLLIYVGDNCPTFAESYRELSADCSCCASPGPHRPTMTTAPSTSPPAPPASPKPFYISTAA